MQSLILYRVALVVPLVLGALVITVLALFGDVAWLNDALGGIGLYLVLAWAVCGIPYALFAGAFWFWSKRREPDLVRRGLLASPLVVAALSVLWWFGNLLWNHGPEDRPLQWGAVGLVGARIVAIILVLGHMYVGIILLVASHLRPRQIGNDAA